MDQERAVHKGRATALSLGLMNGSSSSLIRALIFVVLSSLGGEALAQAQAPSKEECVASFDSSQTLRDEGRLLAAMGQLLVCGNDTCPGPVRSKCVEWIEQIRRDVPSIVVAARDHEGNDIVAGRVYLDGEVVDDALSGRPIEVDPGPHILRIEAPGAPTRERRVVARQGQKNRVVRIATDAPRKGSMGPPPDDPEPTPPEETPGPVAAYASFGVAGLAVVIGTVTGIVAIVRADELEDACRDGICHPGQKAQLESGTAVAHVSTVHFAIAGAAAVSGVIALLLHNAGATGVDLDVGVLDQTVSVDLGPGGILLRGQF